MRSPKCNQHDLDLSPWADQLLRKNINLCLNKGVIILVWETDNIGESLASMGWYEINGIAKFPRLQLRKLVVPLIVFVLITTRTSANYYELLIPKIYPVITIMGDLIHGGLVLLMPLFLVLAIRTKPCRFILPIVMLLMVIITKTMLLIVSEGSVAVIGPSYAIRIGSEYRYGYYLHELLNWIRTFSIVFLIYYAINSKELLYRTLSTAAISFSIPLVLLVVFRHDLIGMRTTFVNGINFGGSIWNIGVRSLTSFGWLWAGHLQRVPTRQKFLFLNVILLTIVSGFAGISRSFVISLLLSFLAYLLLSKKSMNCIRFIVAISIVTFMLYSTLGGEVLESYLERFLQIKSTEGGNIRLLIWENYLMHFGDYWLFGAFEEGIYEYSLPPTHFAPHSAPLSWLVKYGIFGLLAYAYLIHTIHEGAKRLQAQNEMGVFLRSWLVAYASVAFMNETGFETVETFIAIALILAMLRMSAICNTMEVTPEGEGGYSEGIDNNFSQ